MALRTLSPLYWLLVLMMGPTVPSCETLVKLRWTSVLLVLATLIVPRSASYPDTVMELPSVERLICPSDFELIDSVIRCPGVEDGRAIDCLSVPVRVNTSRRTGAAELA